MAAAQFPLRAVAEIHLDALRANYAVACARCPQAGLVPVIKANAYGHGMERVARALLAAGRPPAAVAVATVAEALSLHSLALGVPVLLLGGCIDEAEMSCCVAAGIEPVLHDLRQVHMWRASAKPAQPAAGGRRAWLKVNTGMNRLGLPVAAVPEAHAALLGGGAGEVVLMSHLACADGGADEASVRRQLATFARLHGALRPRQGGVPPASLAASAAILAIPAATWDYIRPGIMLYGSSPLVGRSAADLGLAPVMTLRSRIMAVTEVAAGEAIGYGGTWICERATRVGVVAIGYADGYPRSAGNGTPVLVRCGNEARRVPLAGRVSMDMIAIDISALPEAGVGSEVVLWGAGLPADEVAASAGTIAYELFCRVSQRVSFIYR